MINKILLSAIMVLFLAACSTTPKDTDLGPHLQLSCDPRTPYRSVQRLFEARKKTQRELLHLQSAGILCAVMKSYHVRMIGALGFQSGYWAFMSGVNENTIGHASLAFTAGITIGQISSRVGTLTTVGTASLPSVTFSVIVPV